MTECNLEILSRLPSYCWCGAAIPAVTKYNIITSVEIFPLITEHADAPRYLLQYQTSSRQARETQEVGGRTQQERRTQQAGRLLSAATRPEHGVPGPHDTCPSSLHSHNSASVTINTARQKLSQHLSVSL